MTRKNWSKSWLAFRVTQPGVPTLLTRWGITPLTAIRILDGEGRQWLDALLTGQPGSEWEEEVGLEIKEPETKI